MHTANHHSAPVSLADDRYRVNSIGLASFPSRQPLSQSTSARLVRFPPRSNNMNSSAEDPFPPEIIDGLEGRQIFDAGNGTASLDGNSFFNSALPLDTADMFDNSGLYESTMASPLSFKEQSAQRNIGMQNPHTAQSRSPESFSQDSSSDSSGHRKRKSSSRSSQSPQNLVMAGTAQMESWTARSSLSQSHSTAEKQQQPTSQQRSSDWTHRGAELDGEADSASSSPSFLQRGPRHVAIPVQESPYTTSISPFLRTAQQIGVSGSSECL